MPLFSKRGFRWSSNSLLLLAAFLTAGLVLHYRGRPEPVVRFWSDFSSVFDFNLSARSEEDGFLTIAQQPDLASEEAKTASLADIINRKDFFLPAFRRRDQLVRREGYTLCYSEKYEQASWVAYSLTASQIRGEEVRSTVFLNDPVVKSGSAVSADYTRSGYDRGHLAPAGDFRNSYQLMQETFYMSNISPMLPDFNRKGWSDLEKLVRSWAAKYGQVLVVTGPVLEPGLATIGRINRVAVPREFYKIVLFVKPPHVKAIAFLMPNEVIDKKLSSYVVSVDAVEQKTGINFYPMLPDSIEERIEKQSRPSEWPRLK